MPARLCQYIATPQQQQQPGYDQLVLTELKSNSNEYRNIQHPFVQSIESVTELDKAYYAQDRPYQVDKIHICRIHNQHRMDAYNHKRERILKSLNNDINKLNEKMLYHGSDYKSIISIMHQGFLRQYAKQDGTFGAGMYFSTVPRLLKNTKHSRCYAERDVDGYYHMLLCKVICGESDSGYKYGGKSDVIPMKPNSYIPYESVVDDISDPEEYAIYADEQALPVYLISFTYKE